MLHSSIMVKSYMVKILRVTYFILFGFSYIQRLFHKILFKVKCLTGSDVTKRITLWMDIVNKIGYNNKCLNLSKRSGLLYLFSNTNMNDNLNAKTICIFALFLY